MNKLQFLLFGLICATLLISACKKDDDEPLFCDEFHWGYNADNGPDTWSNCFSDCDSAAQSPINISTSVATADTSLQTLNTQYNDQAIEILNNGHTVEFEYKSNGTFTVNGAAFDLLQFHFHTPSEHTIDGSHFPMEVHLVHQQSNGDYAVIGIMVTEGAENAFLANFSDNLPATSDDPNYTPGTDVNAGDFFPANPGYFTYGGSLTTPTCSETVTWFVMKEPVEASAAQIQAFEEILQNNNRPIQDINGRDVRSFD